MIGNKSTGSTLRISTSALPAARRLPALRDLFDQSIGMEIAAARGQPVELQIDAVPGLRRAVMLRPFSAPSAPMRRALRLDWPTATTRCA